MTAGSQLPNGNFEREESSSSQGDFAGVYLGRIAAQLWAVIMDRVPLGYEDETGFHLGTGFASH